MARSSSLGPLDEDLDALVQRLSELADRARALEPAPAPGEELPDLHEAESDYDLARRAFEARERWLRDLEKQSDALADELLPPLQSVEDEDGTALLRQLQHQVLRHPLAFRAAFAALVSEGRRFAESEEGAQWRERLERSPLLPDLRLILKMVSLSMLDEGEPELLPSAYLDALFRIAARDDSDQVLDRLFGGRPRGPRG